MLALPLPNIPEELSALRTIALDLRWTWSHEADALWEQVDEKLWRLTRNPWKVLQNATEDRLRKLARDSGFCRKLARWCTDNRERIAGCDPALPDGVFNRLADNWRPLFVIGVLPALLTVWVRSKVEESPVWLRTTRSRSTRRTRPRTS